MIHLNKYIAFLLLVLLLGTSCTSEQDPIPVKGTMGSPLAVRAVVNQSETDYNDDKNFEAFPAGKTIRLYYAYINLNETYDYLQGVYEAPGDNEDKQKEWNAIPWPIGSPEAEQIKGIYLENIRKPNNNNQYYFTATSYPEPHVGGKPYNTYQVYEDQFKEGGKFYNESDFVAARAIITDQPKSGLALHFHHLMSQLVVKLVLPKGKEADGFFPNPEKATVEVNVLDRLMQYTVNYTGSIGDRGMFTVTTDGAVQRNIKLHKLGQDDNYKTPDGETTTCHIFSAILPEQTTGIEKLLTIKINGKDYYYYPETSDLIRLYQEQITVVRLTLLSGPSNKKLQLNSVTIEPWKTNTADVGDLFPEESNK